jgi:hypothetical protein
LPPIEVPPINITIPILVGDQCDAHSDCDQDSQWCDDNACALKKEHGVTCDDHVECVGFCTESSTCFTIPDLGEIVPVPMPEIYTTPQVLNNLFRAFRDILENSTDWNPNAEYTVQSFWDVVKHALRRRLVPRGAGNLPGIDQTPQQLLDAFNVHFVELLNRLEELFECGEGVENHMSSLIWIAEATLRNHVGDLWDVNDFLDTLTCDRTQFMLNVWYMDFLRFPSEASYNAQGLQEGEREPGPSKQFLKSFIPTLFHAVNWASDRTTAGNFYAFVKQLIVVDAASHTSELESYGGGLNEQHTGGELFIEIEQRMEDDWDANPSNYQIHALFDDVWQLIVTGKLDDSTEYDEDDLVEVVIIPEPPIIIPEFDDLPLPPEPTPPIPIPIPDPTPDPVPIPGGASPPPPMPPFPYDMPYLPEIPEYDADVPPSSFIEIPGFDLPDFDTPINLDFEIIPILPQTDYGELFWELFENLRDVHDAGNWHHEVASSGENPMGVSLPPRFNTRGDRYHYHLKKMMNDVVDALKFKITHYTTGMVNFDTDTCSPRSLGMFWNGELDEPMIL